MKKKNIFFVLLICFINSSCNKEEQTDELQDKDFYSDVTTRASYISGTITGEMNPYVSDGYYTYDLSIPIQKQSVGIRISAVGGEARFKTNYQERFESTWVTQIPAGKNHFPINVLWTKAGSNSTLMVRPEKSTIELTADLRNINVKMKPMPINAPSTFELGDTITLWCNYLGTKLLQKSEMRKNMVMDLIYRGFIYAANYSESHYNPRRSQIKTELRYLFVTTPNR